MEPNQTARLDCSRVVDSLGVCLHCNADRLCETRRCAAAARLARMSGSACTVAVELPAAIRTLAVLPASTRPRPDAWAPLALLLERLRFHGESRESGRSHALLVF